MIKLLTILAFLITNLIFSQELCPLKKNPNYDVSVVTTDDIRCLSQETPHKNTVVYTFGVWCAPCRLHLKNALMLKEKYDVNLYVLIVEPENDPRIQKNIDYLHAIDPTIQIISISDLYGDKKDKKYKNFITEITPMRFEKLFGFSTYIVFNKRGIVEMVTNYKDNLKNDWRDDINMVHEKVTPLLALKSVN